MAAASEIAAGQLVELVQLERFLQEVGGTELHDLDRRLQRQPTGGGGGFNGTNFRALVGLED